MKDVMLKRRLACLNRASRIALRDADLANGRYFPRGFARLDGDMLEFVRPDMPTVFDRKCLSVRGLEARALLVEHWAEIEEMARDPILEKLKSMAPFVDGGWDRSSLYSPSEIMLLRYFIAVSDRDNQDRVTRIRQLALGWIEEARHRWKAGFYANPFGAPVRRPA